MLKRLAIVGWLVTLAMVWVLTAQDVPKGTPKQGIAKQEASKEGQKQPQGQPHNQAAPNLVPPTVQPAAPTHDESAEANRENLQIQRWLMYFTGGLVGVGFLQLILIGWQAILLRRTREDVHRQADWMETQAGHMSSQVEEMKLQRKQTVEEMRRQAYQMEQQAGASYSAARAADESAKAALAQIEMMKDKERARISVSVKPVDAVTFGFLDFDMVTIDVENFGFTHALNVRATGWAILSAFENEEPFPPSDSGNFEVQNVIRCGASPVSGSIYCVKRVTQEDIITENLRWTVLIKGIIEYDDVFGDQHETRFKRYMLIWRLKRTDQSDTFSIVGSKKWTETENLEDNHAT